MVWRTKRPYQLIIEFYWNFMINSVFSFQFHTMTIDRCDTSFIHLFKRFHLSWYHSDHSCENEIFLSNCNGILHKFQYKLNAYRGVHCSLNAIQVDERNIYSFNYGFDRFEKHILYGAYKIECLDLQVQVRLSFRI